MNKIRGLAAYEAFMFLLRQNGAPPTVREVGKLIGTPSSHTAICALRDAVEMGLLIYRGPKGRKNAFLPGITPNPQETMNKVLALAIEHPDNSFAVSVRHIIESA